MKKLLIPLGLLIAGSLWVGDLGAHGGTYRGPGDTVPPGAGGSGGGAGPSTGGPSAPAGPSSGGPTTGAPGAPPQAPQGGGGGPSTGGDSGADLEYWSFWWEFNKDPFLNLKEKIWSGANATGGGGFFLGEGNEEGAKDQRRPDEALIRGSIVPALLAALEKERANDIVTGCLIALAKIGDTAAEDANSEYAKTIGAFLKNAEQEIRETAAVALGILAHPSSLALLEGLMNDTKVGKDAVGSTIVDLRTRAFAAYGLGLMARRNPSPEVQQSVAKLIAESLPVATRAATPDLAVALITSFGLTSLPIAGVEPTKEAPAQAWDSVEGGLEFLLGQWRDDRMNFLMRAHLAVAMGRQLQTMAQAPDFGVYKQKVAEALLVPLDKRTGKGWPEELQQSAAFALGLVGDCDDDKLDAEIRKVLMEQTLDGQRQTRRFAMIALAKATARKGTPGEKAWAGLPDVSKHLTRRLTDGKGGDEHWAGLSIGVLGNYLSETDASVPTEMGKALHERFKKDNDADASAAFAVSLGILGLKDAQADLLERMQKTKDWTAQGYVTLGLGLMGASEAKAKIQELVKASEFKPDLLKQAAIALGLLGDNNIVPDLTEMLRNAGSLSAQAAIASALGFIGDSRSVDPLVKMLQDESLTDGARGFAAVALGIVADKEVLPWNSKIAVDVNYRASTQTLNTTDGKGVLNIL